MAKEIHVKNIPADEIDDMEATIKNKMHAKNVKRTDNGDGTFDLEGTLPN